MTLLTLSINLLAVHG